MGTATDELKLDIAITGIDVIDITKATTRYSTYSSIVSYRSSRTEVSA
jgi:hypothetical protein